MVTKSSTGPRGSYETFNDSLGTVASCATVVTSWASGPGGME
jgi:hypothetical protein